MEGTRQVDDQPPHRLGGAELRKQRLTGADRVSTPASLVGRNGLQGQYSQITLETLRQSVQLLLLAPLELDARENTTLGESERCETACPIDHGFQRLAPLNR